MPRRSKVELSPEITHSLENQFYSFLDSLSHEETKKFFEEFLTFEEKMMMYKRLTLYWMLFEGHSLASIQRALGVTHDTTRLYNKRKNQMSEDFTNILHRIGRTTQAALSEEQLLKNQKSTSIHSNTISEENDIPLNQEANEPIEESDTAADEFIPSVELHEEDNADNIIDEKTTVNEPFSNESDPWNISNDEPVEQASDSLTEEPQAQLNEEPNEQELTEKLNEEEFSPVEETQTPITAPLENRYQNTNSNTEITTEEPKEKKKKGFGRFFGF